MTDHPLSTNSTAHQSPDARFVDVTTIVAGDDWIGVGNLTRQEALGQGDARFRDFLAFYDNARGKDRVPVHNAFAPANLLACGVSGRLMRLRLAKPGKAKRAGFPGQHFTCDRAPANAGLLSHPLVAQALSQRFVGVCMLRRPAFLSITGRIGEALIHSVSAALPLRGEQGEITQILLPFCDKLGNIPARLREEFFARDV